MPIEIETVPLLKHLEEKIEAAHKKFCLWTVDHIDRHALEAERDRVEKESIRRALDISSAEYARRLDFLNGEAERLREMQMTYILRETYDISHRQLEDKLDTILKELDRLRLVEANMRGQVVAYSAAIALAMSIITFIANHLWK